MALGVSGTAAAAAAGMGAGAAAVVGCLCATGSGRVRLLRAAASDARGEEERRAARRGEAAGLPVGDSADLRCWYASAGDDAASRPAETYPPPPLPPPSEGELAPLRADTGLAGAGAALT